MSCIMRDLLFFSLLSSHKLYSVGQSIELPDCIQAEVIPSAAAAAAAKSLQSCSTLCDPIDGGPTGSPVPGILQARILEWVAIAFSNA